MLFPGPQAYVSVIVKFKKAYCHIKPTELAAKHAEEYIMQLTKDGQCSLAKHRLNAAALNYYFRHYLQQEIKLKIPYRPRPLPHLLSAQQIIDIFDLLPKKHHLAFMLMHGFGLKIGETLNLRIHNIDINNGILSLSKGRKLKLHAYLMPGLLKHLVQRRKQYHNDAKRGHCFIRHQQGHIVNDFQNQPLFVSRISTIITDDKRGRSFINPATFHRILRQAFTASEIPKLCTCMILRHSFAIKALEGGNNLIELKHILGHGDIRTTMNYTRSLIMPIISPLDELERPARRASTKLSRYCNCLKSQAALSPIEAPIYLRSTLKEIKDKKVEGIYPISDLETWLQKIKKAQHKFESFKVMCCEEDHASHPHLKTIYFRDFCQVSDRPDYLFASYSELSQNDSPQRTLLHLIHAMSIPNKGLILLM